MYRRVEGAAVFVAAAVYAAWLTSLGRGITIDMWDGFVAIRNALKLAGLDPWHSMHLDRPPLGWLALLPAVTWGYKDAGMAGAEAAARAMMPIITAAAAAASYFFFKTILRPWTAALAALLLAANPLLIQYSAFTLLDTFSVISAVTFAFAARAWEREPRRRSSLALLAVAALAAGLSKYHLLALAVVPAAALLLPPRSRPLEAAKLALLLPAVLLGVLLFLTVLLEWRGEAAIRALLGNFWFNATRPATSAWGFLRHLLALFGPVPLLFCAAGLALWLREGERTLALSFLLPLAAMSALVGLKEERYLIPLLPLAYAAAARALEAAATA